MAKIVALKPTVAGIAPAYTGAAAGDTLPNDGRTILHVKNTSAGPVTVTVVATQACSHGGTHDAEVVIPAASERLIGPFPRDRFGSEPAVNYSATASVNVAAISV